VPSCTIYNRIVNLLVFRSLAGLVSRGVAGRSFIADDVITRRAS